MKRKTSFSQKIALIFFGLSLFIFILEAGLRFGGLLIVSMQEYHNRISLRQNGTYRILCLGESTTAGQYPRILEEILNKQRRGVKFSVIDKGISGTNTMVILSKLQAYLEEYKPDMVITMMGINDFGPHLPSKHLSGSKIGIFFKSFKTYKLIQLAELHLITKVKGLKFYNPPEVKLGKINVDPERKSIDKMIEHNPYNDRAYLALGHFYQGKNNFSKAIKFFNKAIEINPANDDAYVGKGWCYQSDTQPQILQAIKFFNKAVDLNPRNDNAYVGIGQFYLIQALYSEAEKSYNKAIEVNPKNGTAYTGLGWCYHSKGDFSHGLELFEKALEFNAANHWALIGAGSSCQYQYKYRKAIEYFQRAVDTGPKDIQGYIGLGTCYLKLKEYSRAEETFKTAINFCPGDPKPLGLLSTLYKETGQDASAEEYHQKANAERLDYYNPLTVNNYRKIEAILNKRHIRLVCAEYPMRGIAPLRKIFEDKKGIIFVDNENIFKDAACKDGYDTYFSDMFGGNFGHCRTKGNILLAGNIANAILKDLPDN